MLLCLLYYHFGLTGTEAKATAMAWAEVLIFLINIFFWPCLTACWLIIPEPGIKLVHPAVEPGSPKHCTARQVPGLGSNLTLESKRK